MSTGLRRLRLAVIASALALAFGSTSASGATPTPPSALWISATVIDLGPVGIGTTTPDTVVTVTNVSSSFVGNFAGGGSSNPDWLVASSCAAGVAAGASCQFFFRVTPSATGATSVVSSTSTDVGGFTITGADGRLTGHAIGAAAQLLRARMPRPPARLLHEALLRVERAYNAAGITSVIDPGLGPGEIATAVPSRTRSVAGAPNPRH